MSTFWYVLSIFLATLFVVGAIATAIEVVALKIFSDRIDPVAKARKKLLREEKRRSLKLKITEQKENALRVKNIKDKLSKSWSASTFSEEVAMKFHKAGYKVTKFGGEYVIEVPVKPDAAELSREMFK